MRRCTAAKGPKVSRHQHLGRRSVLEEMDATDERKELQAKIDKLIGTPTEFEIYRFPRKVSVE